MNSLLSKGVFLIQLKKQTVKKRNKQVIKQRNVKYLLQVTIETFSKLRFSGFKKFATKSVSGELQLIQILLNSKTSCYNLKIRGLGVKKSNSLFLLIDGGKIAFVREGIFAKRMKELGGKTCKVIFTELSFSRKK